MICWRCLISGRVQGVWYRGTARRKAEQLGISGYARNLSDGRVEVLACGEAERVAQLRDWLWEGPPGAAVVEVECQQVAEPPPQGFVTR